MVRAVSRERVRVMEQHRSQPHPEGLLYLSWPRVGMTKACPYSAHGAAVAWLIRGPLGNCSAHATSSSFAVPSHAHSSSRLWPKGLRGRRGRPARTTRTAWQRAAPPTWSAKIGTSKQVSAEHRKTVCMHARHAHITMHSAKQHRHRMPGMRYKASSALRTGRLGELKKRGRRVLKKGR